MLYWIFKPLRLLLEAVRDVASPAPIAFGAGLGMMVGLLPKDNLTAFVLGTAVLALRVNLAAAACATLLFSWVAVGLDPLADCVGLILLTDANLQPWWERVFETPLMAWSGLNNSVVLGSLVLGIVLFYPVFYITSRSLRFLGQVWGEKIAERIRRYRIYTLVAGADTASRWRWR
jgi:uncharacterized protein (TIGR03546 family)